MGNLRFFTPPIIKTRSISRTKQLTQFIVIPELSKRQKQVLFNHFEDQLERISNKNKPFLTTIETYTLFQQIVTDLYLLTKKKKLEKIDIIDIAFLIGDPHLINYVLLIGNIALDQNLKIKAIFCGNINSLIHLETKGIPIDAGTMTYAAEMGCLKVLKFCISRGFFPSKDTLDDAAIYGDMSILEYFTQERNIRPDNITLDNTILGSGLSAHRNREATNYIYNIIYSASRNIQSKLCLK